ncbi:MAG: exosortase C-terminal domain/associated protein EpsI [Candidatus Omnitrophota bacterium]
MNKQTMGFLAIIALLVLTGVMSLSLLSREKAAHDRVDIRKFPYSVGEWKGRDLKMTEEEYRILETRNLILREYVNTSGDKLALFLIYSETNRAVFHPPEVCLIGEGMTIVNKKTEMVSSDKRSFITNKLDLEKSGLREMVLYSYKAGKLYTENFYLQQLYLIAHQLFGRNVPGATVRVSMVVSGDGSKTVATLKEFLGQTVKAVEALTS